MVITSREGFNSLVEDIVMKERQEGISPLLRKNFLKPISSSTALAFKRIGISVDEGLLDKEKKVEQGKFDYTDKETGERKKGSFQGVNEAETMVSLVEPIMTSIFDDCIHSQESKMYDFKVDWIISSADRAEVDTSKDIKIEVKRIMHGMKQNGVVCRTKAHIEDTFFKEFATPGLELKNCNYRIKSQGGKQVISALSKGKDVLSSEGLCVYTNSLVYAVSITYNDRFSAGEIKELRNAYPIIEEVANKEHGIVYTGAFDGGDYPFFVFHIKYFDEESGEYCINEEALTIFRNLLYSYMYSKDEWYDFRDDVHKWFVNRLREKVKE